MSNILLYILLYLHHLLAVYQLILLNKFSRLYARKRPLGLNFPRTFISSVLLPADPAHFCLKFAFRTVVGSKVKDFANSIGHYYMAADMDQVSCNLIG